MKLHRLTILFFLAALFFYTFGNHLLPVTDPVESNYALTAKEMVQSGNWLSPQIYHQFWYDKPIMIYWLIALSYKVLGISDFAARLPSALFGALTVGLMYQEMRTITGRRILSIWSSIILGSSLAFWVIAHGIITDMVLIFATMGTMAYAYRGLMDKKPWLVALAYAYAGIAVLTKGPVGLVLPGLLLILFAASQRSLDMLKRLFPWQGILAFCLVGLPWYIFMYVAHGQAFIDGFLGFNNMVRATVSEHPADNVWWYYLAVFLGASLPWTGVVIYEMVKGRSRQPDYLYLMIWGWGTILFYSLMATKYPTYTLISLLPFSILGAMGAVRVMDPGQSRARWLALILPTLILWGALFAGSFFVKWGFWYLLYVLVAAGFIMLISLQWQHKFFLMPAAITVITMLISVVVIHEGLTPLIRQRSSVDILPAVESYEGDQIYYLGGYDTSLVYYTGREVWRVEEKNNYSDEKRSSVWNRKYTMPEIDVETVSRKITAGEKVLLLVDKKTVDSFQAGPLAPMMREVYHDRNTTIYETK